MTQQSSISAVFSESEILLLCEGMARLKEAKTEALRMVRDAGVQAGGHAFEERDFGLPEIERLLDRLSAE